ncbi:DNA-3-methyladenine glycosylase I [Rahnella ecdela]|uniref:DNA-3-methyladenine glycosylase I n=1 Tax=Rahnella ecdela TaxID=2816250 RepID=A0ABS6LEE6_9GAMM|nr:DNA-3-methyladenine glycosylase I [Rahnella ecdela]MBU9845130.1 DNA-3-methyladenine glycosylase I [Rahnella ecdela]
MTDPIRCPWGTNDPMMTDYHDREWGKPVRDGRALWEKLMLDGFQAGLSWRIVLKKRDALRLAFCQFEPEKVAEFTEEDVERLANNADIIRSRIKIRAVINNARAYLAMKQAGEDFGEWIWAQIGGKAIQHVGPVPTKDALSERISKDLKKRGFKFVGPTIVYAWLEATGLINTHHPECFRRAQVAKEA